MNHLSYIVLNTIFQRNHWPFKYWELSVFIKLSNRLQVLYLQCNANQILPTPRLLLFKHSWHNTNECNLSNPLLRLPSLVINLPIAEVGPFNAMASLVNATVGGLINATLRHIRAIVSRKLSEITSFVHFYSSFSGTRPFFIVFIKEFCRYTTVRITYFTDEIPTVYNCL